MAMRVVLAMSGGVDSSAAAKLLLDDGYEVIGLFMRSGAAEEETCAVGDAAPLPIIDPNSNRQGCCSAADAADARRVADQLGIPFHAVNFADAFERIKDYFVDEYLSGRTPNPCVMCNNWLKFGHLWDFAKQVGAERIATGHYARLVADDESQALTLRCGRDTSKDQSYVLFGIDRALLPNILFPVGNHTKPEIRELAGAAGVRVAEKPDSQEICFIPDNDYAGFIERRGKLRETSGELVDTGGNVVGQHAGFEKFTIGQRKGLGVTFGVPKYVVKIEPDTRRVVLGDHADLARTELEADRLNWLVEDVPAKFTCRAQIRYGHEPGLAEVQMVDEDRVTVQFDEPQYGVAPGQAVVFYDDDRVLGGGWIR